MFLTMAPSAECLMAHYRCAEQDYRSRVTLTPASTVPYIVMPDSRLPESVGVAQPAMVPSRKAALSAQRMCRRMCCPESLPSS